VKKLKIVAEIWDTKTVKDTAWLIWDSRVPMNALHHQQCQWKCQWKCQCQCHQWTEINTTTVQ
jgi:hypothetical protein